MPIKDWMQKKPCWTKSRLLKSEMLFCEEEESDPALS